MLIFALLIALSKIGVFVVEPKLCPTTPPITAFALLLSIWLKIVSSLTTRFSPSPVVVITTFESVDTLQFLIAPLLTAAIPPT